MWTVLDDYKVNRAINLFLIIIDFMTFCVYIVGVPCSNTGSIRLVGGIDQFQGRVEVCTTALVYSTVCSIGWDNLDAQVVCRQLGFGGNKF